MRYVQESIPLLSSRIRPTVKRQDSLIEPPDRNHRDYAIAELKAYSLIIASCAIKHKGRRMLVRAAIKILWHRTLHTHRNTGWCSESIISRNINMNNLIVTESDIH